MRRYDGYADAGKDAEFGKPGPLSRIEKPPFVAVKACMIRHIQQNGLRVNTKAQMMDRSSQMEVANKSLQHDPEENKAVPIDEEKVIPHLCAVGETAASMGWRRVHGRFGVCGIFGRIAGKNAAGEEPLSQVPSEQRGTDMGRAQGGPSWLRLDARLSD